MSLALFINIVLSSSSLSSFVVAAWTLFYFFHYYLRVKHDGVQFVVMRTYVCNVNTFFLRSLAKFRRFKAHKLYGIKFFTSIHCFMIRKIIFRFVLQPCARKLFDMVCGEKERIAFILWNDLVDLDVICSFFSSFGKLPRHFPRGIEDLIFLFQTNSNFIWNWNQALYFNSTPRTLSIEMRNWIFRHV